MSTQANPAVAKIAEGLISTLNEKFVPAADFEERVSSAVSSAVTKKLDEAIARAKAETIAECEAKFKAPGFISNKKWFVKSPLTGKRQEMEYSLGRIIGAQLYRRSHGMFPTDGAYEHEVAYIKEAEKLIVQRAVSEGTSGAGGTLIPQEWTDFVIPELGAQVVFQKAGPNVLPMQHQVLNIPGLTNNQTCFWIGENSAITEESPTTNNTPLTLHTAASLTGISDQWLRDATPETDAALQAGLVRGLIRFVDSAYFNGTGSSNQPTGMLNVSSINQNYAGQGAENGSAPTYDDFSLAEYALELQNAPRAGRTWFMNPRELDQVRRLKDTLGRPLFIQNLQRENLIGPDASPEAIFRGADGYILGYPVFTTTAIPLNQTRGSASTCSTIFLIAMSDIYVGQGVKSQGLEVAISDQAMFTSAEVAVRLLYRTDVQPGHAVSIVAIGGCL